MRRIRYQVACSLDGFIAGPGGDFDWITHDPDIDFAALLAQFDMLIMGRRTYDVVRSMGLSFPGKRVVVVSRTLRQEENPEILVLSSDVENRIRAFRDEEGLDIWLYGGGELFSSLLGMGLVDSVEPAIIPILLGGGIPFLPSPSVRRILTLTGHRIYSSGIVLLEYSVSAGEG